MAISLDELRTKASAILRREVVPVEGLGEFVVQEFNGLRRDELAAFFQKEGRRENFAAFYGEYRRLMLRLSLVTDTGELLFPDAAVADEVMNVMPALVLEQLYRVAQRLNAIEEGSQEAAEKN